jgi:hypothetical protein
MSRDTDLEGDARREGPGFRPGLPVQIGRVATDMRLIDRDDCGERLF